MFYINDSYFVQTQHSNPLSLSRSIPSCYHRSFKRMTCFQHPPPEVPSIKSTMFNQNSKVSLRHGIIGRSPRASICMALLTKLAEIKKKKEERRERARRRRKKATGKEAELCTTVSLSLKKNRKVEEAGARGSRGCVQSKHVKHSATH